MYKAAVAVKTHSTTHHSVPEHTPARETSPHPPYSSAYKDHIIKEQSIKMATGIGRRGYNSSNRLE